MRLFVSFFFIVWIFMWHFCETCGIIFHILSCSHLCFFVVVNFFCGIFVCFCVLSFIILYCIIVILWPFFVAFLWHFLKCIVTFETFLVAFVDFLNGRVSVFFVFWKHYIFIVRPLLLNKHSISKWLLSAKLSFNIKKW